METGIQTDGANSFLRAARAGNLEKVMDYLKGNIDIDTANVVSSHICFPLICPVHRPLVSDRLHPFSRMA